MKPSNELFDLIGSMSKSEKRFFRIFSGRHGKKPGRYLDLFDRISTQAEYREETVRGTQKHFAAEKNYLHEAILDSLNIYQREKTYLARHAGKLVTIELLYKRSLFKQCMKQIQRAKATGYKQELYPFLLMFLRWETIIHIKNEDEKKLEESLEEEIRLNEILRIQYALMQLAFRVQIRLQKGHQENKYIRDQKKNLHSYFPIPKKLNSFWASYYYYSTQGLLATAESDQITRYESFHAIKDLMERAPIFIQDLPGIYHLNMNNFIGVMFRMKKYGEAEKLLVEQRQFMDKYGIRNITLGRIMFLNTAENELFLHYKTGAIQSGMKFLKEIDNVIHSTPGTFSPLVIDVLFMMGVLALLGKDLRASSRYLNRIMNEEKESQIRPELGITTRILYLLVLFEEGDVLFESRYQSTRRLLRRFPQFSFYDHFIEVLFLLYEGREKDKLFRDKWKKLLKESKRFTGDEANKQFDFFEWLKGNVKD